VRLKSDYSIQNSFLKAFPQAKKLIHYQIRKILISLLWTVIDKLIKMLDEKGGNSMIATYRPSQSPEINQQTQKSEYFKRHEIYCNPLTDFTLYFSNFSQKPESIEIIHSWLVFRWSL
jgi:hypothetical protein